MSQLVRISESLTKDAKLTCGLEHRSLTSQIEHWASIGRVAESNPDLPFSFIKETLFAIEEMKQEGTEEYAFG